MPDAFCPSAPVAPSIIETSDSPHVIVAMLPDLLTEQEMPFVPSLPSLPFVPFVPLQDRYCVCTTSSKSNSKFWFMSSARNTSVPPDSPHISGLTVELLTIE